MAGDAATREPMTRKICFWAPEELGRRIEEHRRRRRQIDTSEAVRELLWTALEQPPV